MKRLLKIVSILALTVGISNAKPIDTTSQKGGYEVNISSKKTLVVGNNDIVISISKDGTLVKDAKVKIKAFMPEMPGMPYMENKQYGKLINDKYEISVNFSMSGTWQIQLMFKTADGKVHKIKSSVNI